MNKVKHIILSLLVIFISFLIIDEGKTFMLIDNIQIHLNPNQNNELEIPHLHKLSTTDDEKCMSLKSFGLSFSSVKLLLFACNLNERTVDYNGLVWQPPKSL